MFERLQPILGKAAPWVLILWLSSVGLAQASSANLATALVGEKVPQCQGCTFYAVPIQDPIFTLTPLYFVSTLDVIPPPFFSVAVDSKGKAFLVESQPPQSWNRLVQHEKLKIKTRKGIKRWVSSYLKIAGGRAFYLEKLLEPERERVKKKLGTIPPEGLVVKKKMKLFDVSFFGKDAWGQLKRWQLQLNSKGEISRLEIDTF